jgi:hypothetical protein
MFGFFYWSTIGVSTARPWRIKLGLLCSCEAWLK